jgi:hypothetical protein
MDTTQHITIGPEFFSKAPLDYSNPSFALIREFAQNCVDAPNSDYIAIDFDGLNTLTVANNGTPMTESILTEVFLSLGGTNKGVNSVGGFGKAKELLCFCHDSYKIESGDLTVHGSGASYKISRGNYYPGTRTTISLNNNVFHGIENNIRLLASRMNWSGSFFYNGILLDTKFNAKTKKTIEGLGRVKVLKGGSGVIVRVGGVPMFSDYGEAGTTVILDLIGDTKSILTSNRDGLRYRYDALLSEFLRSLSTNKRKALQETTVEFIEYGDTIFSVRNENENESKAEVKFSQTADVEPVSQVALVASDAERKVASDNRLALPSSDVSATFERGDNETGMKFTIRNETGMKIDRSYFPATFGKRSKRLLDEWTNALMKVHKILEITDTFAVGFIFSEDASALYEKRAGIKTYYVSPVSVDKCGTFRTMRSKRLDKHDLLAFATHEVLHGQGYEGHDENFAAALTYAMVKVLRNK